MKITVLFGTESGNSELIANDIAAEAGSAGHETTVFDLQDFDPANFTPSEFYVVVCSTHGEGDLPNTALPFAEAFDADPPAMDGIKYAVFGLGDTFYEETYSRGSEHLDARFSAQGAKRVGEYGRHDASGWDLGSDVALAWLPAILEAAEAA